MVTERQNIAPRLVIKTLSRGENGFNIIFTDIGSLDTSTKSGLAGTCSQQEFIPMASTKPSHRWTLTLF